MRTERVVLGAAVVVLALAGCAGAQTPEDAFYDDFQQAVVQGQLNAPVVDDGRSHRDIILNVGNGWCDISEQMPGGFSETVFVGGLVSQQDWDEEAAEALIDAADEHLCEAE